jgi:hypothetical protein
MFVSSSFTILYRLNGSVCKFIFYHHCATLFRASPLERWATEEEYDDPFKRAFMVYYDYGMHI